MTPDQIALLADTRLSPEARVMGLLLSLTEGIELPYAELRGFLRVGADRVKRAALELEDSGWSERRPGGRGHGDTFSVIESDRVPETTQAIRDAFRAALFDRVGEITPSIYRDTETGGGKNDRGTETTPPKPFRGTLQGGSKAAVVVVDDEGSSTPLNPPTEFDPKAEAALAQHATRLAGCRGALRDYLVTRVPPASQLGYVQTIASWLDGGLPPRGLIQHPRPTKLLATALNELAAQDEQSMKNRVGDIRNLRTKVEILARQKANHEHDDSRAPSRRAPAAAGVESGSGTNPSPQADRRLRGYGAG